jgi:hypothetical protein
MCINNATSNIRLTADSHSQNCLQTLFFPLSLSLKGNYTELYLHTKKLTETVLHLNLGHFVVVVVFFLFYFWLFAVPFYFIFPLWWDNYRTTTEAPSPGLEAEGWTSELLRLKLYCIWTWRFFHFYVIYFLFYFIYLYFFHLLIFIFILFIFYFQSSVTLMSFQLTVDYTVSPCFYLWNFFCLFLCFVFYFFVFLFSFNFFAFHLLPPFHSKYH